MISEHVSKALERQMRNWELVKTQRLAVPEATRPEVEDFVCLSRTIGVDARDVAERVAGVLGWPVFDRQVLDLMAGNDFDRKVLYASMDERDLSWSEENLRSFFDSKFVRNDYFHRLCETLLLLARKGHGVFLGRGADLILPQDFGFRVRLTAPFERRAAWMAEKKDLALEEAVRDLERNERERTQFFQHHFRVETDDPTRFDITLNMERFTADQAAQAILATREIRRAGRC